ncbi:glutathione-dependent thiol reductase [Bacillus sp. ZZV12-4809]|nr:glutathione-dependent thiol reductase [Bacillus sp. ZZV12-4809]
MTEPEIAKWVVKRMALTFYWYPKCGTCRKAKKWLDEHNLSYEAIHITDNPPSRSDIEALYKKSGMELKKFFNTSGQKYRELGLKDKVKTSSDEELLDILATDGMLIKRPLLTDGEKVTVGFKEEEYEKTWLTKVQSF